MKEMKERTSALLADLYQLTMLQAYHDQGMENIAVFEFFVRTLPPQRNFLVAAGLEQALDFLETLCFTEEEIDWLASEGRFDHDFLDKLATLHFSGDVQAVPEGTVFFAEEPILQVIAPLPQAQLVESRLINLLQFQTMIASKAARAHLVAPDKLLVDFGLRRAHGAEAALLSARASYLAGFDGTATMLAGMEWNVPIFGTMAHSFIQAHENENTAFENFAQSQQGKGSVILLIDTYNTEQAARHLISLAHRLHRQGIKIHGVRLDSGDLVAHAQQVRRILDEGGLGNVEIFASSNLDEYKLRDILALHAPIDGFGIGTRMNTSADAPYLDCAYKLQEYAGIACRKRSEGKATWPGRKQVFRELDANGCLLADYLTTADDNHAGFPLLIPVMQGGKRIAPQASLQAIRAHCLENLARLPETLRELTPSPIYPVTVGSRLRELAATVDRRIDGAAQSSSYN